MANTVATIVEGMSVEQGGKMADQLLTYCRKHGSVLPKSTVQEVLKQDGEVVAKEQFEVLRKYVERRSKIIVRRVTINWDLTPEQMIAATKRKQYVTAGVLATMPRQGAGIEKDVDMYFFPAERQLTIDEQEAEARGVRTGAVLLRPDPGKHRRLLFRR